MPEHVLQERRRQAANTRLFVEALILLGSVALALGLWEARTARVNQQLLYAIGQRDRTAVIQALRAGADPNFREREYDYFGSFTGHRSQRRTALDLAFPDLDLLSVLLDAGADVTPGGPDPMPLAAEEFASDARTAVYDSNFTPLVTRNYALQRALAERLIAHGMSLNARDSQGRTTLYLRTERGDLELVRVLLERGADVNAPDAQGVTPLLLAVRNGSVALTSLLLAYHADPRKGDATSETPLSYLDGRPTYYYHGSRPDPTRIPTLKRLLLAAGAR